MRLYLSLVLLASLALTGVLLGLWWAPFVAGLAAGAIDRRARITLPAGAAIGLLSWAVPLGITQASFGLGPTAQSLAAIMGFGHQGALPVALTLVVGTLLGLAGAWLASAVRLVVASSARVDAIRNG